MTATAAAVVTSCLGGSGGAGTLACTPAAPLPAGAVRLSATIANLSGVVSAPAGLDAPVLPLTLEFHLFGSPRAPPPTQRDARASTSPTPHPATTSSPARWR